MYLDNTIIIFPKLSPYHIIFYINFYHLLFMIETSSDPDMLRYEENITKILDKAVKLFRRTNLEELADKWDRILKTYDSKKRTQ